MKNNIFEIKKLKETEAFLSLLRARIRLVSLRGIQIHLKDCTVAKHCNLGKISIRVFGAVKSTIIFFKVVKA